MSADRTSLRHLVLRGLRVQVSLTILIGVLAAATFVAYLVQSSRATKQDEAFLAIRDIARNTDSVRDGAHDYTEGGGAEAKQVFKEADAAVLQAIVDSKALTRSRNQAQLDVIATDYANWKRQYGTRTIVLVDGGEDAAAVKLIRSDAAESSIGKVFDKVSSLLEAKADQVAASERRTRLFTIVGLGLIFLAGAGLIITGVGVLRRIRSDAVDPLERLASASRAIGSGRLDTRVEPSGFEETYEAGATFNQMADEIEQQVVNLRELDEMKQRFVSSVSHDLLSPLTSVNGYLDLLASQESGSLTPDQLNQVEVAQRGTAQLREMIDDLLTVSRMQHGVISLEMSDVDVGLLLREVVDAFDPIAIAQGVKIDLRAEVGLFVRGDRSRLRQVFENIIGNAVKFSDRGGTVTVQAGLRHGTLATTVTDEGVGIPPEEIESIGERFYRASTSAGTPGSGIGLSISKEILRLHDADLSVESTLGEGSTFVVRFPLSDGKGRVRV